MCSKRAQAREGLFQKRRIHMKRGECKRKGEGITGKELLLQPRDRNE